MNGTVNGTGASGTTSRSGLGYRLRDARVRLRRMAFVRVVYQNVRYGWFTVRNGMWRLLRSRRGADAQRSMSTRTYEVPIERAPTSSEPTDVVEEILERLDVEIRPGTHTVYVPPTPEGTRRLSAALSADYPPTAGLKVLRDTAPVESASYLTRGSNSRIRRALTGTSRDQALAANRLHVLGLGPRVWDVCNLSFTTDGAEPVRAAAFVVDHVEGTTPTTTECEAFMDGLEKALDETSLEMTMPAWRRKPDFGCPGCNGNLLAHDDRLSYVDFQTFAVDGSAWRDELAERGATTHFDTEVPRRGGRDTPKAIPGARAPAAPGPEQRWATIASALASAGVTLDDRLVIDVGCNAAAMSHFALTDGAHWTVGLDQPDIADYADELLLALGSSRHTVVPGMVSNATVLTEAVPEFLQPRLDGSVILYLAVRDKMGIMPDLTRFSWRALVYEGHPGETVDESKGYVAELVDQAGATIAVATRDSDGDPTARPLLILTRR